MKLIMRLLLPALVALALTAAPAGAYNANRSVSTTCLRTGVLYAFNVTTQAERRTTVPCYGFPVWSLEKQGYMYFDRPYTDMEAALRSARVWYPKCEPRGYSGGWDDWNDIDLRWWTTAFHVCI